MVGCATRPIPDSIKTAPVNEINLTEVSKNVDLFNGADVRWAGRIVKKHSNGERIRLEVLQLPIQDDGSPLPQKSSNGRFIADFDATNAEGKPLRFQRNQLVTVFGKVAGSEDYDISNGKTQSLIRVDGSEYHTWLEPNHSQPRLWPYFDVRFGTGGYGSGVGIGVGF